jgi:hypothetical protein
MGSEPTTSELTRVPVNFSAVWLSKTVVTDPPRYVPHEEWWISVRLEADTQFRVAVLMHLLGGVSWGLRPEPASGHAEVPVHFFPHAWSTSERVQINVGWRRITVADSALKEDPQANVTMVLPDAATTGRAIPVCELQRHAITVALLAIAEQDTQSRRRHRWRVRPELAKSLPVELVPLTSRRQSGLLRPSTVPTPNCTPVPD